MSRSRSRSRVDPKCDVTKIVKLLGVLLVVPVYFDLVFFGLVFLPPAPLFPFSSPARPARPRLVSPLVFFFFMCLLFCFTFLCWWAFLLVPCCCRQMVALFYFRAACVSVGRSTGHPHTVISISLVYFFLCNFFSHGGVLALLGRAGNPQPIIQLLFEFYSNGSNFSEAKKQGGERGRVEEHERRLLRCQAGCAWVDTRVTLFGRRVAVLYSMILVFLTKSLQQ